VLGLRGGRGRWGGRPGGARPSAAISLALLVAALLVGAVARPAAADSPYDYGYTGGSDPVRTPDNRNHAYCQDHFDLHEDWQDAAMGQLDAQTVMSDDLQGSCTSATDVVWIKTALDGIDGGESIAKTTCATHVSWGVCDQAWVQIDQPQHYVLSATYGGGNPSGWYSLNLQVTMRHELGHTAGLHHWTGALSSTFGAMNIAFVPNGTSGWLTYLAYRPFQVDLIDEHL
jgi:hypothetical protein